MTFRQLRNKLMKENPLLIQWNSSKIVERAELLPNGAVQIHNLISNKKYNIPRRCKELDIKILTQDEHIFLGSLIPKDMK